MGSSCGRGLIQGGGKCDKLQVCMRKFGFVGLKEDWYCDCEYELLKCTEVELRIELRKSLKYMNKLVIRGR